MSTRFPNQTGQTDQSGQSNHTGQMGTRLPDIVPRTATATATATSPPSSSSSASTSTFAPPITHGAVSASASAPPPTPKYALNKTRHASTISIGEWSVRAEKRPILSIKEVEAAEKQLNLPLPEMTFGNNALVLTYTPLSRSGPSAGASSVTSDTSTSSLHQTPNEMRPSARWATLSAPGGPDASSGSESANKEIQSSTTQPTVISFTALDALAEVGVGEGWEERLGGGVRVSMADKWGKQRSASPSLLMDTPLPSKPVKPHDWTYSTIYTGSISGPSRFVPSTTHEIPIALLSRQHPVLDQILFYDDVPLFEDELHDNGESIWNARIRVMPHSWFILARLFVRVDNVLFRLYDVRLYHALGSDEVVREISGMEADYDHVKAMLEKPSDLSPLTDANWVSRAMTTITSRAREEGAGGGRGVMGMVGSEKGREGGKAWPGLGRRVEVMRLGGGGGGGGGGVDGLRDGLSGLSV